MGLTQSKTNNKSNNNKSNNNTKMVYRYRSTQCVSNGNSLKCVTTNVSNNKNKTKNKNNVKTKNRNTNDLVLRKYGRKGLIPAL